MSNMTPEENKKGEEDSFLGNTGNRILPVPKHEVEEHKHKDIISGFWIFKGPFLQRFATETIYVAAYGIGGCFVAMSFAYFNGIITTLENRYKIPTKNLGIISVGNDIGTMFASVITGYYLRKVHRPRWIGLGLMTTVFFCLMTCSLHFLYGPGEEALQLTREYSNGNLTAAKSNKNLCMSQESGCEQDTGKWTPQIVLFAAQLIQGVGAAIFLVIGIAYMDDNTTKSKSPAMLTFSSFLRMLGPASGYSLASLCLSWYIEPQLSPLIKQEDPRWLGAWWLGWIVLAIITFIVSFLISLFPKELPSSQARRRDLCKSDEQQKELSIKDMWKSGIALTANKVYVYNNLSSMLYFFGYTVYWIFTPKYIETQYRQSASMATMATGSVALAFSAVGVVLSGYVVTKYKPSARSMAAWNTIVNFLTVAGVLCYVAVGCKGSDQLGSMATATDNCNASCHCEYVHYAPICSPNNVTFISACHAGCSGTSRDSLGRTVYTDCACINRSNITEKNPSDFAMDGACPIDCTKQFFTFLAIMCLLKLLGATSNSTGFLISIRCIPPELKSFGLGVGCMFLSLFTFIPSPIFYGWLIDRHCLVWGKTCTNVGNCWLYDTQSLRYVINVSAAVFIFLGGLFSICVWYYAKDMQIFDEPDNKTQTKQNPESLTIKELGSSLQLEKL